jgi:hypothetical protein
MTDAIFDAIVIGLIIVAAVLGFTVDWVKDQRHRKQQTTDQQRREVEHD